MRFGTFSEVFGADSKDGDTYNMKIIQTVMVCIATAVCSGASVYHVDAVGGDDSSYVIAGPRDTGWGMAYATVPAILRGHGKRVAVYTAELNEQIIGVNTPEQLAETEKHLRLRGEAE